MLCGLNSRDESCAGSIGSEDVDVTRDGSEQSVGPKEKKFEEATSSRRFMLIEE